MSYDYNKNEIKENLDINQVADLIAELGGEPRIFGDTLTCRTICHGGDSHKLYYYDNTKLFRCYTGCSEPTFDIFELVKRVKQQEQEEEYQLPFAIDFVARYFGYSKNALETEELRLKDFTLLEKYDRIKNINRETKIVELKYYDDEILTRFPTPVIETWVEDGISNTIMKDRGIKYDPKNCGIVIPHYDINNKLIGIRERTLVKANEIYGKYRPAKINKVLYNHPLSFNLYNINNSKDNIKIAKRAFVFESEKSCLQYATMFGRENDLSVAVCGSSFIQYQAWLLINMGVTEIVVGFDKQYKELGDAEHQKLVKNLKNIHNKYGKYVKISYLFDKGSLLPYKASPTDCGRQVFLELYNKKVSLYA